ncbi:hypothetical protein [Dactylosporangium sp. CA-092794]|uniref:hypothetical protein n=1 Tax=Dactylosporangium sp. CA-092794 TaxID=3239929 RepID=UPI003D928DB5
MGYPEWERSRDGRDRQVPETGRWDLRQERWVPQPRNPDDEDYGIEPFPARSDPYRRPGQGRVLDYEDWDGGYQRRPEPYPPARRDPSGDFRRPPRSLPPEDFEDDDDYEDDEDEPDQRSVYIGSFIATACWYLVAIAAYAGWSLTLSTDPRPGCTNAFGLPCPAPRTEALTNLFNIVPQIAVAMAISITIAMFLGWLTTGWRALAIGFASAVLGAGVATVLFAVLETQF